MSIPNLNRTRCARPLRRARGFTLLELALGLVIVGVLAAGVLVPFVAQVAQRKIADTERVLEQAKESLLGYAMATGRLPCPATTNSQGLESFAAGGSASNGNCSTFYGFLPAVTLGFSPIDTDKLAPDGFGTANNRIRYAVSNQTVNSTTNPFTRTSGMRQATSAAIASSTLLYVCSSGTASNVAAVHCGPGAAGTGGSETLTASAPFVLWSNGANAATGGNNAHEAQNPHPNAGVNPAGGTADRVFVSRDRSEVAGVEFDDILTWISVGNLVSRLVLAGQLP